MVTEHFPDGVKIGPDSELSEEDNRLPIYEFDEWVMPIDPGTMDAGEVKVLTVPGIVTFRAGTHVKVSPQNATNYSFNNYDKLLVLHAHMTPGVANEVSIVVKNIHSSQVTFQEDQWLIAGWNASAPE